MVNLQGMWELSWPYFRGLVTARKFLLFVAALLVAVFGYIFTQSPTVSAADVEWSGSNVVYEGNTYQRNNNDQLPDIIGVSDGAVIFQYPNDPGPGQRVHFIYFTSSEAANAGGQAQYVSFEVGSNNSLTDREGPTSVSVEARPAGADGTPNEETSSCEVDGIGWIVCPITVFLARGTDWLFNILTNLLEVQPLLTDTDAPLFRIWSMMLGLANLAFIIAFLVIIYSQVTSIGISNYGIKRMLPRLIIAAILVNISYYVCAIAVDLSNILGYQLQDMFINMRNQVVGEGGNGWQIVAWEDVATVVLSGGAAAAAGVIASVIAVSTYGVLGAIFLLLPALLGVLLAILVAILILAARQAIITVLIIIAPLAFVAYLLPNTEKWFDKWRGTFMTMLLLFPIFSVLFGGAQLAGAAIIQNAGSLDVLILGMATQIAPIVITPFLIKFSGSLLGRIAGMVNNPNRGLIDRTRNFSKDQAEHRKLRRLGNVMENEPKRHQIGRRTARSLEMRRRKRDAERSLWQAQEEEGWVDTDTYKDLQSRMERSQHRTDTLKQTVSSAAKADIQGEVNIKGSRLHIENAQLEAAKGELSLQNTRTEAQIDEYKTLAGIANLDSKDAALNRAVRTIQGTNEEVAIQSLRKQSANYVKQRELAQMLGNEDTEGPDFVRTDAALKTAAGIDPSGRLRAQSDAMSNLVKMKQEDLDKSLKLLSAQAVNHGTTMKDYTSEIVNNTLKGVGKYDNNVVEAALEFQASDGNVSLIEKARISERINQTDLSDVIARNAGTMKSKGGFHLQANADLSIDSIRAQNPGLSDVEVRKKAEQAMAAARIETLSTTSAADITSFKVGWIVNEGQNIDRDIKLARQFVEDQAARAKSPREAEQIRKEFETNLATAYKNVDTIINHEDLAPKVTNLKKFYENMQGVLSEYKADDDPDTPPGGAKKE